MSKIIIGLVLGVAVVGGGYVYMNIKGAGVVPAADTNTVSETGDVAAREKGSGMASGKRSLNDLVAAGGNYVCTFSSEDPNAKNSGTVYISGENMRGDFESVISVVKMTVQSHMIHYGGFIYTWSDAAPGMGIKMARVAGGTAAATDEGAMSGQQSFDAGVAMEYDCKEWTPDLAKFDLPSKVKFTEIKTK